MAHTYYNNQYNKVYYYPGTYKTKLYSRSGICEKVKVLYSGFSHVNQHTRLKIYYSMVRAYLLIITIYREKRDMLQCYKENDILYELLHASSIL